MFGTWRDLTHFYQISDLLAHFNVSDDVWDGFLHQIGPLGEDVRLLAALPRLAIVAACSNALHGDGSAFVPVDATQVGLVWRMARRVMAYRAGVAEENFTDEDPWSQSSPSTTSTSATPGPTSSGSGVKERVLKMASLIDQQDESELMPPTPDQVHGWVQNFVKIMGSMPDEIEEPTGNQLAGLAKRVISQRGSPYVDFAVWVPFERKLAKNHKFRIYTPLGDGSFLQRDLPGPASFQAWTASWRVFRMLNISSLAAWKPTSDRSRRWWYNGPSVGDWSMRPRTMQEQTSVCRCPAWVYHESLVGKSKTEAAGEYPQELCEEVAKLVVSVWKRILSLEFWRHQMKVRGDEVSELQKKWTINEMARVKRSTEDDPRGKRARDNNIAEALKAEKVEENVIPSANKEMSNKDIRERQNENAVGGMRNPDISFRECSSWGQWGRKSGRLGMSLPEPNRMS